MNKEKEGKLPEDMSIEEILSSIRGVINSHSTKKIVPKRSSSPDVGEDDILELTETYDSETSSEEENLLSDDQFDQTSKILNGFSAKINGDNFSHKKRKESGALEDLVIDILKPEIKSWLNNNLQTIVRQIVEKEIKRLNTKN